MKADKRERVIIHVVNKISIGGVERIMQDLHIELSERSIHSIIFEIAPNEISRKFFSLKILRVVVFFAAVFRLTLLIAYLDIVKKKNCNVLFYHAECHLLGRYIPLPNVFAQHSLGIMSLFQSPKLYPQKLLPKVIPGIEKTSRNLCYSTNVVKGWEEITSAIFFNLPLGVRIETSRDIEFASKSNHSGDALKILHIGRDTPWKKPELAAIFAQKVAALGIKVELHYLGIKETNSIFRYQRKPNLEIYFHGLLKNIDSELFTSDILVNLFDCSLSLESIGVGALEALALGKSVVIEKMGDTSFNNLYGIYEREEILKLLTDNVRLRRSPLEHISMTEDEYRKNLNEISISTYTERLLAFIDKFTEGSTIKGS